MESDPERVQRGTKKTLEAQTTVPWMVATAASPPHVKGNGGHGSVFATEHDDQFVHAVDGLPTTSRSAAAIKCVVTGRYGRITVYAPLKKLR